MLHDTLRKYVGQPVAVLCARYWYRGILARAEIDHLVLTNPRAVEVTGPSEGRAPEREDPIPSDLIVRIAFIEIVCQPNWVSHEMDAADERPPAQEVYHDELR